MLPPHGFVPAGAVVRAERSNSGPAGNGPPILPRMLRGLRYQSAVDGALKAWADSQGVEAEFGPWFRFLGSAPGSAWRWCQPDVVIDPGPGRPLVVLEVKLSIEPRAWWQLEELYRPVVEAATGREVVLGAICQSWDPAVRSRVPGLLEPQFADPGYWLAERCDGVVLGGDNPHGVTETWGLPRALPVLQWKKPQAADF